MSCLSRRDGRTNIDPACHPVRPPSTDPIDGLNKPLGNEAVVALRDAYNSLSRAQCGVEMDWDRGYVLQVARFDPSKGLPILLAAYLRFRQAIENNGGEATLEHAESPSSSPQAPTGRRRGSSSTSRKDGIALMSPATPTSPSAHRRRNSSYDFGQAAVGGLTVPPRDGDAERKPPMLVVVGHGSVDDPDGTALYEQCSEVSHLFYLAGTTPLTCGDFHQIVHSPGYELIRDDVSIVRAPPSDTLLGMLMQGAWVACQLSTKEGFEVKVSEGVLKRVPVIVSQAGGLSLQVKEGVNGWLVDAGESEPVAKILTELWQGKRSLKREKGRPEIRKAKEAGDVGIVEDHRGGSSLPGTQSRAVVDRKNEAATKEDDHEGARPSGKNGLGLVTNTAEAKPITPADEALDLDPNTVADIFCEDVGRPFPAIHVDETSPSEDFFTIGNAARWLLLWSMLDGRGVRGGAGLEDGDLDLLQSMGLPLEDVHPQGQPMNGQDIMRKFNGENVWRLLMGADVKEGEGRVL